MYDGALPADATVVRDAMGVARATTATTDLRNVFISLFYQCTLRMADDSLNEEQIERDVTVEALA